MRSTLDVFELSCGTPSRYVVMLGLAGLDPIPRNRGLLSLRAVKSEKCVLGEKIATSRTVETLPFVSASPDTAVTLTGSVCKSAGSFCAVTVTVGS